MLRRHGGWIAGWILLTGLILVALRDVAWNSLAGAVATARPAWLVVALLANATILPLGAAMWRCLLARDLAIRFRTLLWTQSVTAAVSNAGPFPTGHLTGIHLLATRGGVGYDAAVSVRALDQVAEGAAKLVLVLAVIVVVPVPSVVRTAGLVLVMGVAALGATVAAWAGAGEWLHARVAAHRGRRAAALDFLARVATHLAARRRSAAVAAAAGLAVLRKAAEGGAIWSVAASLGADLPAWGILLALGAVNLATLASVTPANLGIYEASAFAAYRLVGAGAETALALAVLQHAAYLVSLAGPGWLLLPAGATARARRVAAADEDPAAR